MNPLLPVRGDLFEEQYRIRDRIGRGGYAVVYRAVDEEMRRDVAIKILIPPGVGDPYDERVVARFLREGRLISELHDSHTITLHDYGKANGGLLYMVFEFIDGTPLDQLINSDAPLPPTRVARILLQVLDSLTEAHQVGVLHRDIKPSNIMVYDYLGDTDLVKVLDFGIAKPVGEREVSAELTREGVIIGTPRYMSPEHVVSEDLTPACDIFSLGLVALEMLSGQKALVGEDDSAVLRSLLSSDPVPIPDNVLIPTPMRLIIERMVEKNLDERFSSTTAVIEAIHAWLSGRAVADWLDPETSKTLERTLTHPITSSRRQRGSAISLAATVGVFLLGGLSTAAVFRVTDLETRLRELRFASSDTQEPKDVRGFGAYGEKHWNVTNDAKIRYRFVGADGMIETDDASKIPVRSHEVVEVMGAEAEPLVDEVYVTSLGEDPLRVRIEPKEWTRAAHTAMPVSWEIVSNVRGRAIAVAREARNERKSVGSKPKTKIKFDIPLVKP